MIGIAEDHTAMPIVDSHPNTPSIYPGGTTFMDQFADDQYSTHQKENLYYPFMSRADWQLASWLLRSHLSMVTCQDRFFTNLISMKGLGVRGWPSGKTEMLCSVVMLPKY